MQANEITKQHIHNVRDALKALTNGWAKKLAAKMFPEETEEKGLDKVYNIISGSSRDQEIRRQFVTAAGELKTELELEQKTALQKVKEITK